MRLTRFLNLPAPGRRQTLYILFRVEQSPVFLINSRQSRFTVTPTSHSPAEAPLIPKLRGHFAEFLNQRYLERLRLLVSPTCVSFSTVTTHSSLRGFSWTSIRSHPEHYCRWPSIEACGRGFAYDHLAAVQGTFLTVPRPSRRRHPIAPAWQQQEC